MDREQILGRVADHPNPWDIIIIGGGSTGVGCALDAAARGYDVLLLEQNDFGKGTSSRSTKLIHGGVRYLAQGNISLIREALRERAILLKNAPHVVRKQDFIVPCYSLRQKYYYGAGLKIYDLLAGSTRFRKAEFLSADQTIRRLPTAKREGLKGGILYSDGQFDDTRLLIDIARTADANGAALLNHSRVTAFSKDAQGTVTGIEFEDVIGGRRITASGRIVINAAGAFCDRVRKMSDADAKPLVTLSQGIHLVFDRGILPTDAAIMIPKTSDGRVLFCIPWNGYTLIGTTDTPIAEAELEPIALENEIDLVLKNAARYLDVPIDRKNVLSIFAGVRPLVRSDGSKATAALSRGYSIEIDSAGLLTITGGKWTTYRRMAEEAIDRAAKLAGLEPRPSSTINLPIADGSTSGGDVAPIHRAFPYTVSDVQQAVRNDMAQTVEDVLARRTRALFLNAEAAIEMAPQVARIMAKELKKDEKWIENQMIAFEQTARSYKLS